MLLNTAARVLPGAPAFGRRAASALSGKYAKAAFGAALSKSPQTVTKVGTELTTLASTIKANPEVATFISNPTLSRADRAKGLAALFAQLEGGKKDSVSEVTKNLLSVLSENGRLGETQDVIVNYNELLSQYKGELTVTVTSATALPKDILTRLETSLKASQTALAAKSLKIENKVRI